MTHVSGAMALLRGLIAQGIDTVFGLPGGQLDHFFDALYHEQRRVRFIGSRHEQGAAYMAFGYARSTGRPSVYAVVPGPGVLNTAAALCTAYACNAPVLCLTGQIPSGSIGRGFGELHELPDQLATLRTLTKWAARVERVEDTPALVAEAFRELTSGRPRPVSLEMAMDVMAREADVTEAAAVRARASAPDPDAIAQAARLIAAARAPMIYVGGGAAHAPEETRGLAELLQAPVVSFRAGRGIVSDEHPLALTLPAGHRLWPRVDLVIGIGSRMMEPLQHWGTPAGLKVVRIDIDPAELTRHGTPDVGIAADSALTLRALVPALERLLGPGRRPGLDVTAAKQSLAAEIQQIQPQLSFLSAIREVLPRDGIFCDEITQCGFASWYGFPVYAPRQHINCGYQGTLGYGYATALGVKVAHPDRAVVSIAGDGGFMFNVQEMATAAQYGIGLKTVVFNSNSFGNVQRQQREWFGNRLIGSDLRNPDFVGLAEAFGVASHRARTPEELARVLERTLPEPGPALIEVPVTDMASPWKHIILPPLNAEAAA
ncbi:MAG TPA: thiamine pyrophosphate-dependent enzyme [Steroidobacteraceae bacterium]|nr:thiamine pyrophosphate-dependent enzyme [Steroidobacteraceae bacterium]